MGVTAALGGRRRRSSGRLARPAILGAPENVIGRLNPPPDSNRFGMSAMGRNRTLRRSIPKIVSRTWISPNFAVEWERSSKRRRETLSTGHRSSDSPMNSIRAWRSSQTRSCRSSSIIFSMMPTSAQRQRMRDTPVVSERMSDTSSRPVSMWTVRRFRGGPVYWQLPCSLRSCFGYFSRARLGGKRTLDQACSPIRGISLASHLFGWLPCRAPYADGLQIRGRSSAFSAFGMLLRE